MRGTWVEALDMGGLGGPKQTIYNILGQAVTLIKSANSMFGIARINEINKLELYLNS